MPEQDPNLEEIVRVVFWKLYLEPHSDQLKQKWQQIANSKNYQEQVEKISESLANICKRVVAVRLGINQETQTQEDKDIDKELENILGRVFKQGEEQDRNKKLQVEIRNAIRKVLSVYEEISPSQGHTTPQSTINELAGEKPTEEEAPIVAQWKYLPVPDDEPDKHDEYSSKSRKSPDELNLIGARVRGKMHKHNGTNCDDWFEFDVSGDWAIIAVSDGAGSKKFSRVGAKVSCQAAVQYLVDALKSHKIKEFNTTEDLSAAFLRKADWSFKGENIEDVQKKLHEAIKAAYNAVEKKANEYRNSEHHKKAFENRELDIKDLSATLILAVHTTVRAGETNYNIILTCQVGDGMVAAVSGEGKLQLLGKPDIGEHGGETEFLTSKSQLERNNLVQKTFLFTGNLNALMMMTDGVADDYFPNEPGMLELYGDLVLNQVINIHKPNKTEIINQPKTIPLSISDVKELKACFQSRVERITDPNKKDEPKEVSIYSVADYAKELKKSVSDVVASKALLAAGIPEEQMCNECETLKPEQKLQLWLDSYYRKSSFDDRTLVVLYRGE